MNKFEMSLGLKTFDQSNIQRKNNDDHSGVSLMNKTQIVNPFQKLLPSTINPSLMLKAKFVSKRKKWILSTVAEAAVAA